MDLGLKGLKAILVGANGGIGRVVAHTLAAEGCSVAVCGRSEDKVSKIASELAGAGVTVVAEALDVTDAAAVPAFVEKSAKALGGVTSSSASPRSTWAKTATRDGKPCWTAIFFPCAEVSQPLGRS